MTEINIPGESRQQELRDIIAHRNVEFEKLEPNQKRVAVAKDVLEMLAAKKIIPRRGVYMKICNSYELVEPIEYKFGLHEILDQNVCQVCALGGLFAALVMNVNGVQYKNLFQSDDVFLKLYEIFDKDQLKLIEIVYEGWECDLEDNDKETPESLKVRDFHKDYWKSEDRMVVIMKNIIENDGTFVF